MIMIGFFWEAPMTSWVRVWVLKQKFKVQEEKYELRTSLFVRKE